MAEINYVETDKGRMAHAVLAVEVWSPDARLVELVSVDIEASLGIMFDRKHREWEGLGFADPPTEADIEATRIEPDLIGYEARIPTIPFRSVVVDDRSDEDDGWVVDLATDRAGESIMFDPDTSSRWYASEREAVRFAEDLADLFCVPVVRRKGRG